MTRNIIDGGICQIDTFIKRSGMKESRLGLLACANPKAVQRVRDGSASVATLRALLDFIARHGKREGK